MEQEVVVIGKACSHQGQSQTFSFIFFRLEEGYESGTEPDANVVQHMRRVWHSLSLWGTEWEDGSMQFQLSNPELCSYQSAATHCIAPGAG